MKKILVLAALVSLASASTVLALTTITSTPVNVGSTPYKASTGVTVLAAGDQGGYNCASKHISGDKSYTSSSISASIQEDGATKGVVITAIPTLTNANEIYTGSLGGY